MDGCPDGYMASVKDGQTCELIQEEVVPFVFLAISLISVMVIGTIKVCGKKVHLKNTLIGV